MDAPITTDQPKQKISKFAFIWIALIVFCLLFFVTAIGMLGWGLYSLAQQAQEKSSPSNIVITAIVTPTPLVIPEWPVVYQYDFEKVSYRWYTGDHTEDGRHETRSIANGVYSWKLENAAGYTYWQDADAGDFKNFTVSVDARHTAGTPYDGYGVIFCIKVGNYYKFVIQDRGYYYVEVWKGDRWSLIIPSSQTNTIKPGEINHLMVMAQDGTYNLFINGDFVRGFWDGTLSHGDVGMVFSPDGDANTSDNSVSNVEFDNFEVRAPKDPIPTKSPPLPTELPRIHPEGGKLVFASNQDGNLNLYTVFTNGSGVNQLTNDPAADFNPRWSPDGMKIAFVSDRDGNSEIYVMDADGKNVTRLTDNPADDISPDWSPDGKQIIFASQRAGNYDLYLMSTQGEKTSIHQLTNTKFDEINPSISPDGSQILFQENENNKNAYKIFIMQIDGTHKNPVTDYDDVITYSNGAWAPDSYRIAYDIRYLDVRGEIIIGSKGQSPATMSGNHITKGWGASRFPGWSPSGRQIVFVSDVDGQSDIYIILADGNGLFRVTHNDAVEESPDWHE